MINKYNLSKVKKPTFTNTKRLQDKYATKTQVKCDVFDGFKALYEEYNTSDIDSLALTYNLILCEHQSTLRYDIDYNGIGGVSIHSDKFIKRVNNHYSLFLKILSADGVIEVIKSYIPGVKSKNYKISDDILSLDRPLYTLNTPKVISRAKEFVEEKTNIIPRIEMENYNNITLPTIQEVKEASLQYEGKISPKGKIYIYKQSLPKQFNNNNDTHYYCKNNGLNVSILDYDIENYERILKRFKIDKKYNGFMIPNTVNCGRVITSLNLLPKWIRKLVKIDNEQCIELDLQALHPNLLSLMLPDLEQEEINNFNEFISYDSHTKMSNITGLTRNEVKILNLSYYNTKKRDMESTKYNEFNKLFKSKLPTIYNILMDTKEEHKKMSFWMFQQEVTIIEHFMVWCYRNDITVFQCFDAIYVSESKSEYVKENCNRIIKELNLTTKIG